MLINAVNQDGEISLFGDATHLQEIIDSLCQQSSEPGTLPASSEQVIADVTGSSAHLVCPVCSCPSRFGGFTYQKCG